MPLSFLLGQTHFKGVGEPRTQLSKNKKGAIFLSGLGIGTFIGRSFYLGAILGILRNIYLTCGTMMANGGLVSAEKEAKGASYSESYISGIF